MTSSATFSEWDRHCMKLAITAAERAAELGEVPVGAVIARDEQILAVAHNAQITQNDPTGHAEVLALRKAATVAANYRLPGATLYVTLEPCTMCCGAFDSCAHRAPCVCDSRTQGGCCDQYLKSARQPSAEPSRIGATRLGAGASISAAFRFFSKPVVKSKTRRLPTKQGRSPRREES